MEKLQQVELNEDEFRARVGARLRACRERAKVTPSQLSRATQLPRSTISKIERGNMGLDVARAHILATALGVHVEEFLDDSAGVGVAEQN